LFSRMVDTGVSPSWGDGRVGVLVSVHGAAAREGGAEHFVVWGAGVVCTRVLAWGSGSVYACARRKWVWGPPKTAEFGARARARACSCVPSLVKFCESFVCIYIIRERSGGGVSLFSRMVDTGVSPSWGDGRVGVLVSVHGAAAGGEGAVCLFVCGVGAVVRVRVLACVCMRVGAWQLVAWRRRVHGRLGIAGRPAGHLFPLGVSALVGPVVY
jgi:hypothetical protein